jgi:cystathionine gamma-synthase
LIPTESNFRPQTLKLNLGYAVFFCAVVDASFDTLVAEGPRPAMGANVMAIPITSKPAKNNSVSTLAIHAGENRQKLADAITDPIVCSSTYTFANTQAVIDFIEQQQSREEYGRYGNPSVRVVERKLAALEGAEQCLVFASGMAAITTLLLAKLNVADEVLIFDECYHRTREFCHKHLSRFGIVAKEIRTGDFEALEAAITPRTKMLISEAPTNPHLSVIDVPRFAEIGHRHEIETMIDATLATPYNLRPMELGVDYVVHSATKYLGGHNDLLAGCLLGSRSQMESVEKLRGILGGVSSPHCAYLLERGLKTFEIRMQRHNENGMALAEFLTQHPRVEKVYYPGLPSHRDYATAQALMRGFGGLVTFLVRNATWRETGDVVDAMKIARIAPSLGGVETLIEQPLVMSYFQATPEDRRRWGIADNMIRVSCGLENSEDLIADFAQALEL